MQRPSRVTEDTQPEGARRGKLFLGANWPFRELALFSASEADVAIVSSALSLGQVLAIEAERDRLLNQEAV